MGAVINSKNASELPASAVVGAANNVLADDQAGRILQDRGILYAPDFATNAGGAFHLVGREVLGWSKETAEKHTRGIGKTLNEVYSIAKAKGTTTDQAAQFLARCRVDRASARVSA
ncbi:MAG: hypothetical protein EOO27_34465 [Comamonadaceae bacterium]|nr:MAG: hypothetical protein EOO27_34465 [Comamonadaceae bacterium]